MFPEEQNSWFILGWLLAILSQRKTKQEKDRVYQE